MTKLPHIPEFCAKVSQEYLDGVGCYNTNIIDLYDRYPISYVISRRHESLWLKLYRDGMLGKNQGQIIKVYLQLRGCTFLSMFIQIVSPLAALNKPSISFYTISPKKNL